MKDTYADSTSVANKHANSRTGLMLYKERNKYLLLKYPFIYFPVCFYDYVGNTFMII